MANRPTAGSIDEYIAEFPPETQMVLEELRALIRATAPGVTERISYAIPAFDLNGRRLVYIAGWKKHVGLYPVSAGAAETFHDELKPYKQGKGSVQFPLEQPMPTDLIRRIVEHRVEDVSGKDPQTPRARGRRNSMAGWFELSKSADGQFRFVLKAGNAETILTSELYQSKSSAENGIASVWNNCGSDERYEKKVAANEKHFFNLKAANHQTIGTSQMYGTAQSRDAGIASVKSNGTSPTVKDNT